MNKNSFIKISAAVFIFLAIGISLFPPFEFGNEKLRTLSERKLNTEIVEKLPIKEYDFIFSNNKKYFALTSYDFVKKFYDKDSLKHYENLWGDKKFKFKTESTDTFLTASRLLHEKLTNKRIAQGGKYKFRVTGKYRGESGLVEILRGMNDNKKYNYDIDFDYDKLLDTEEYTIDGNRIIKYN